MLTLTPYSSTDTTIPSARASTNASHANVQSSHSREIEADAAESGGGATQGTAISDQASGAAAASGDAVNVVGYEPVIAARVERTTRSESATPVRGVPGTALRDDVNLCNGASKVSESISIRSKDLPTEPHSSGGGARAPATSSPSLGRDGFEVIGVDLAEPHQNKVRIGAFNTGVTTHEFRQGKRKRVLDSSESSDANTGSRGESSSTDSENSDCSNTDNADKSKNAKKNKGKRQKPGVKVSE